MPFNWISFTLQPLTFVIIPCRKGPPFLFKSRSWPNQIWSWSDGWLHFRETTPLRDPGSPRITNGFLIIFHHPILCLSLISPMIPETSRELHLNLRDQSRLRSSLSRTCLTAPNTPCVHKACVRGDRRYTSAHHHLTLSLQEWPRSATATTATSTSTTTLPPPPPSSYCIPASPASPHLLSHTELLLQKLSDRRSCFETFFFFFTHRPCISVSGGSTCRWWNLSSLKSWWAFPSSHGCSSHTWLPEDFPGYNFNRFLLSVILHCNKMRQTYVLLVHFFFFRDTCGCLCSKYAAQEKVNNKT